MPKRGFKSILKNDIAAINLSSIQKFYDNKKLDISTPINLKTLIEKKIINKKKLRLKILGDGNLKNKINISANFISKQAKEKIEKIGGTLNILKK